jgi:hypothetical protein
MSPARVFLTFLKIVILLVVAGMVKLQIPELQYDLGTKEPVRIESPDDLSTKHFGRSTFVSVRGTPDLSKAATFAKHGVRYTYFLLSEYGNKLVVRSPETPKEDWTPIEFHVGRLRPYQGMPFSRSVRAGFAQFFDVTIPDDAFSLARDDVPSLSGWSVGAVTYAVVLWCVLAYFFFVRGYLRGGRGTLISNTRATSAPPQATTSRDRSAAHHAQPEPAGNKPDDDRHGADQDAQRPGQGPKV